MQRYKHEANNFNSMNLENLVVISGRSAIFKMLNNKNNGMIAENLDTHKRGFFSTRSHQFTPLQSIQVYTTDEKGGAELEVVFENMLKGGDVPDHKAPIEELRDYFSKILPEHDREQVHNSDIKKIVRWFNFLNERDMLTTDEEAATSDEEE